MHSQYILLIHAVLFNPRNLALRSHRGRYFTQTSTPTLNATLNPAPLCVQDARGFVEHTLVKVPYNGRAVFFRVTSIDMTTNAVTVRLERFTLFWEQTDILLNPGESKLLCRLCERCTCPQLRELCRLDHLIDGCYGLTAGEYCRTTPM